MEDKGHREGTADAGRPENVGWRPLWVPETLPAGSRGQNHFHGHTKMSFACVTLTLVSVSEPSRAYETSATVNRLNAKIAK